MKDLSLHILDIAENSIAAGATEITIKIVEDTRENLLLVEVSDNGKGMDEDTLKKVHDPFFTTKCKRTGLGIPLLAQSAQEAMGEFNIVTKKDEGTTISASFQYDHIDRKPLGDLGATLIVLIASNSSVDFIYEHRINGNNYLLKTRDIKDELEGLPINNPAVINYIKDVISTWLINRDNMLQ